MMLGFIYLARNEKDSLVHIFKDIYQRILNKDKVVMNVNGGYIGLSQVDWQLLEEKIFTYEYGANLKELLLQENGKNKNFKQVN